MKPLVERIAQVVVTTSQDMVPVKTGRLKDSIIIAHTSSTEAIVQHAISEKLVVKWGNARVIYPIFVHEGTARHVIEPKKGKALNWKGAAHPMRRVVHPGTKSNPYFEKALKSKEVDKVLGEYGEELMENVFKTVEKQFGKF